MATLISKTANLTPRQREIYEFIKQSIMNLGIVPTVREIGDFAGIKSPNGVICHLHALVKKGLITREANLSRAIQLTEKPERKTAVHYRGQFGQSGKLTAARNGEQIEFLDVLGSGDRFCFRAADDSFSEEGIGKGDYLICQRRQFYRDGDRVVAQVNDQRTVLTKFFDEGKQFRLESTTSAAKAIRSSSVTVLGSVIGVVRKF